MATLKNAGRRKQISVYMRKDVLTAFDALCVRLGLARGFAIERTLVNAINEGRIPGVEDIHLQELRENKKFGAATPVYDPPERSENVKGSESGRTVPATPAE